MSSYLVILGAVLSLTGAGTYIRDTLKGKTQPNRVTYGMWALAPLIAAAAELAKGVTWAVLPVFMAGFCPFLVLLSSFANRRAYWKLGILDYLSGIFSLVALILWIVTRQPDIAIVLAILSDGLAAVPTLAKARSHPESETGIIYALAAVSAITGLAAVEYWTFAEYAFPAYLLTLNISLSFLIYGARLKSLLAPS